MTPPDMHLRFDLRVPPFATTTFAAQYGAALEIAEWAEGIGVRSIGLGEHHGDPAGYLSAPLTLAGAVLARTRRAVVTVSAVLAPLHDPVRLAEQLATLDCLGPGRIGVVLGAGYRKVEFAMAGVDRAQRGRLVEECASVLSAAWTGEPFEFRGRTVVVTPTPATPGGPPVAIGGKTEIAARRAARLRRPFSPATGDPALAAAYHDECARQGYDGVVEGLGDRPMRPGFLMVARDPEATWAAIAEHAYYDAATYATWQDDPFRSDWVVPNLHSAEDLRSSGRYLVLTPEECIARVRADGGITFHPLMGGIAPALAWEGLRLFEAEVLPAVAATASEELNGPRAVVHSGTAWASPCSSTKP
jgi:alkanesulfonate monooxygenase SsuD/methylene tetrahydromethanopterin reductase-like flavin-dependent oxidoreductase (luciferase family)